MYSTNTGNFILFSHTDVTHVIPVLCGCGGGRWQQGVQACRVRWREGTVVSSLSATSSWWRLDSSAGGQLHIGLLTSAGCGPGAHPLLDFSSHGHEGLLHIGGIFGTGFQEWNAKRVCKLLDTLEERGGLFTAFVLFLIPRKVTHHDTGHRIKYIAIL